MVYCPKCGTKNENDAKFCIQCGASLYEERAPSKKTEEECFGSREREHVEECFGIPYGRVIVGIIFGLILIIWGALWVLQQMGIIQRIPEIWPLIVIMIGIIIIVGALYRLRPKKSHPPSLT